MYEPYTHDPATCEDCQVPVRRWRRVWDWIADCFISGSYLDEDDHWKQR